MLDVMRKQLITLALALLSLSAQAAGPQRNLLVELRWVESSVSGAALSGVREGAVVVGTAGSVSPRVGGSSLSTQRRGEALDAIQRLLVLNGRPAGVSLAEQVPMQWLDYAVELPQPGQRGQPRFLAAPRTQLVERTRGFVVTPDWPGGEQPVRVEFRAMAPEGGGQAQVHGAVQVALGDWITVARSGAAVQRPEAGVVSSRDAEPQSSRELQIRVSLPP